MAIKCCQCFGFILAVIALVVGIIMITAGFTRLTVLNNRYSPTECVVTNKELQTVRGVCVAGKCSPSKYLGRVEFRIPSAREIWTTVIESYEKNIVTNYMAAHFILNQETQCYLSNDGHLIFQLHNTSIILALSIIVLLIASFLFFLFACCMIRDIRKRNTYVNLDQDQAFKL
jgi:hypothetical protein